MGSGLYGIVSTGVLLQWKARNLLGGYLRLDGVVLGRGKFDSNATLEELIGRSLRHMASDIRRYRCRDKHLSLQDSSNPSIYSRPEFIQWLQKRSESEEIRHSRLQDNVA